MLNKPIIAIRRKALLLAAALCAAADMCSAQQINDASSLYEKLAPSVWTVVVNTGTSRQLGSAVAVGDGRLVTNCHVLSGGRSIAIVHQNVSYGARLVAPDAERDLCIVAVENFHAPVVSIAPSRTIKIGERVFAIGSPLGRENTLSDGLISAIDHDLSGAVNHIQFTAPISHGSSGGGLFDSEGRLIGITTSAVASSEAENINFAIPAAWIAEVNARAQVQLAEWRRQRAVRVAESALPPPRSATNAPDPGATEKSTVSGASILLSSHGAWRKNCEALAIPTITTVQAPQHGRLQIRDGEFPINSPGSSQCNGRTIRGTQVFYTSDPDFKGREVIRYISSAAPNVTRTAVVNVR
ncbi:S1C family serine protease [Burkholderia sp. Ac-20379]|uniref:S1C family serine protease n=1 Tax=Burkholderia sp. Ac-20379 TaxID=2703900 RepID=UPI0019807E27|nr:S1C family serine protease [Burkholderia sp. Ac-20379]MBN3723839.1 serine protease [Burkholderia sp. Ac-20379]